MKKPNKRQQAIEANQHKIQQILGISFDVFAKIQFEAAYEYLQRRNFAPDQISQLTYSEIFWTWWKNEYQITDRFFINDMEAHPDLFQYPTSELREHYEELHYCDDIYIDKRILRKVLMACYEPSATKA